MRRADKEQNANAAARAAARRASAYSGPERRRERDESEVERRAVPEGERALGKGWWLTVDTWPPEMMRPLDAVTEYETNPRLNETAVPEVEASLGAFGAQQTIVYDRDSEIVVGHTRYKAARALGWPAFPMQLFVGTKAQAKAYRLADNKTGERAEWDYGKLKLEFDDLAALGVPLELTGFKDFEVAPIRESQWTPPALGTMPEPGQEANGKGEHKDPPGVVRFDKEQWPRVEAALTRLSARERPGGAPSLPAAEALTRICGEWAATLGERVALTLSE
jgi:hypothetical protein